MTYDYRNANQYRDDADADDRLFWRGHNRRKHTHYQTARDEQRDAFMAEARRPEPARKPALRVLPIINR